MNRMASMGQAATATARMAAAVLSCRTVGCRSTEARCWGLLFIRHVPIQCTNRWVIALTWPPFK